MKVVLVNYDQTQIRWLERMELEEQPACKSSPGNLQNLKNEYTIYDQLVK